MHNLGLRKISIDCTLANVAYRISSSPLLVPWFMLFVPSGNTASIYLGDSTVTSAWIPHAKASSTLTGMYLYEASQRGDMTEGDRFDLTKLFVLGTTAGDDVIIQYPAVESI